MASIKYLCTGVASSLFLLMLPMASQAAVISGSVYQWDDNFRITIGDGTNSVQTLWSRNTSNKGWFYGSSYGNSDVAYATAVIEVTEIDDASIYHFESLSIGPLLDADADPLGVGFMVVMRNVDTGHYGVLRIDDIAGPPENPTLDYTWWFQTNGTGDFSVVPLPAAVWLFGSALLGLLVIKRKKA